MEIMKHHTHRAQIHPCIAHFTPQHYFAQKSVIGLMDKIVDILPQNTSRKTSNGPASWALFSCFLGLKI